MKLTTKTYIHGSLDRVFALAEDVMRWPDILPHYRYVRLLDQYGNKKVLEMSAYVNLLDRIDKGKDGEAAKKKYVVPVKWTVIQESIPEEKTILFWHIAGPMKNMEVEWTFGAMEYKHNTIVEVRAAYMFNSYWLMAKYAVGSLFLRNQARNTMRRLKEIVEAGTPEKPTEAPSRQKRAAGSSGDHGHWTAPRLRDTCV